jgi:hypothetical protein
VCPFLIGGEIITMDPVEERLKSAPLALRAAQDMLQDIRRATTDQAETIDNLCAKR